MIVGKIREIWRYPVKSMLGESIAQCQVASRGLVGDRNWAVRDEHAREMRGGREVPKMLQCSAKYLEEPHEGSITVAEITLPDDNRIKSNDSNINTLLSKLLDRSVTLWPLQPASNTEHYKRREFGAGFMARLSRSEAIRPHINNLIKWGGFTGKVREAFNREPDEPIPDMSVMPADILEYTSPLGTYFNAFPIHIITTATLTAMEQCNSTARWDARRFRPNFVIETNAELTGLAENSWCNRILSIGETELKCEIPTPRCGMTTNAQSELPKDNTILRTIVRDANQVLGVYANIIKAGRVSVGDAVELQ